MDALVAMLASAGEPPAELPRVCFAAGQLPGALPDGTIRLDPAWSDAENAARLGHLASHATDGLYDALEGCEALDRAVALETAAHDREARLRLAFGLTGPPPGEGVDAIVAAYRTRCERGMPRNSAAPGL